MKKAVIIALCIALVLMMCACTTTDESEDASASAAVSAEPTPRTAPTPRPSRSALMAPTPEPTVSADESEPAPTGPSIYPSYAYMVSYDPARGFADFDYITLLEGEEAVEWLIDEEGMDPEEAEWMAEETYVVKNTNPQIRTLDLREAEVTVLFDDEGYLVPDHPVTGDLLVLYELYQLNPDYVLDAFFYYVDVGEDGVVISLEQIYAA